MERDVALVDPTYAKTGDYAQTIAEIAAGRLCPFCPEHFDPTKLPPSRWHPNVVEAEDWGWMVTQSSQPYENARLHFMLILKAHKEHFMELTYADWTGLQRVIQWVNNEYGEVEIPESWDLAQFGKMLEGGGIGFRFGETKMTGATVVHLHAHLIIPEIDPETGRAKPVIWPIG